MSATLATLPLMKRRRMAAGIAAASLVLLAGLGAVRTAGRHKAPPRESTVTTLETGLASVELRTQVGLTGPRLGDGGGIVRLGNEFLLVTGRGALYRVAWGPGGTELTTRRLPVAPPMDWHAYLADQPDTSQVLRLRVTGALIDTVGPPRLYVSHQLWHHDQRCYTLAVSTATLARLTDGDTATSPWEQIFDSHPCVRAVQGFDDIESGGRMVFTPQHELLLSVGDFGFDGIQIPDYPQDTATSYGKILRRRSSDGKWETFSLGHRNPQGLTVDDEGRIWETEHGPRGGDEINVVEAGANYGWPLASYGAQYGAHYWPRSPTAHDHGSFTEPVYAFMPSIGVSNLIQLRGTAFPQWTGDLLVASLNTRSLWRVRRRGTRVTYVEQMQLGRRARDLVEGADGRVVIWTDEGDLLSISAPRGPETPAMAYGQCRGCHEVSLTGTALGPNLRGVFGRKVASGNYPYTPSLRSAGGSWTPERLDAFLRDPSRFAPGTAMTYGGVQDSATRRKLIEYLRTY